MSKLRVLENVGHRDGDEGQDRSELHKYDAGIEVGRFFDSHDQNRRDREYGQERQQVELSRGLGQTRKLRGAKIERGQRRPPPIEKDPLRTRYVADLRRKVDAIILQERNKRAAPTTGDG